MARDLDKMDRAGAEKCAPGACERACVKNGGRPNVAYILSEKKGVCQYFKGGDVFAVGVGLTLVVSSK